MGRGNYNSFGNQGFPIQASTRVFNMPASLKNYNSPFFCFFVVGREKNVNIRDMATVWSWYQVLSDESNPLFGRSFRIWIIT
jgi:hypothetical protein